MMFKGVDCEEHVILYFALIIIILKKKFLESLPSGVGAECGQTGRGRSDSFPFHYTFQCNTGTKKCFGQSYVYMFI